MAKILRPHRDFYKHADTGAIVVVEMRPDGTILGSCPASEPLKDLDSYQCKADNNLWVQENLGKTLLPLFGDNSSPMLRLGLVGFGSFANTEPRKAKTHKSAWDEITNKLAGETRSPGKIRRDGCLQRNACDEIYAQWPKVTGGPPFYPVCPILKREVNKIPLPDLLSEQEKSPALLDSIERIRAVFWALMWWPPTKDAIVFCSHRENILKECLDLIKEDLELLPKRLEVQGNLITSQACKKLIAVLEVQACAYEWDHNHYVYELPRPEAQENFITLLKWQNEPGRGALACHFPAAAIAVMANLHAELGRFVRALPKTQATANDQPAEPPDKAGQGNKITKAEANVRARQLLMETPTWDWTCRKLAKLIPCALAWIPNLPAWRAYHEKRQELRGNKTIDTVSLSEEVEAVLGEGEKDEVVKQLIAEQEGEEREDARQAKLYLSSQRKPKRSRR